MLERALLWSTRSFKSADIQTAHSQFEHKNIAIRLPFHNKSTYIKHTESSQTHRLLFE